MTDTSLASALAKVQGQLTAVGKDKKVNAGQMRYTYADLAAVQAATLPLLAAEGLAWVTRPTLEDGHFVLAYSLIHGPSGEREDGVYPLPDPTRGTPQQIGSAITYGRRYCLSAVIGVATEDDDGAAASDPRAPKAQARREPPKAERGPLPPGDDPWAKKIDPEWRAGFLVQIGEAGDKTTLLALFDTLKGELEAGRVPPGDAADLRAVIEERAEEITQAVAAQGGSAAAVAS